MSTFLRHLHESGKSKQSSRAFLEYPVKLLLAFYGLDDPLTYLQQPHTGPCSCSDKSSSVPHVLFVKFALIFIYHLRFVYQNYIFVSVFSNNNWFTYLAFQHHRYLFLRPSFS